MKCARLNLRERPKSTRCTKPAPAHDRPRRYCQRRMVDPDHEDDPRWNYGQERFHYDDHPQDNYYDSLDSQTIHAEQDLYLTVQTLKFEGNLPLPRRPKSCFKYKAPTDRTKHRLFIKQTVNDVQQNEEDRRSALSSYYFMDYDKYLNTDKLRPTSAKSSALIQGVLGNCKQNKSTQVDLKQNLRSTNKPEKKLEIIKKVNEPKREKENSINLMDAKVTFHKSGKRKSLTISRTPSPETIQVIRVDVVCNRTSSCSTMTDYEDPKKVTEQDEKPQAPTKFNLINPKHPNFFNKYLLTNTIKSLDQNLAGSKVTLLCKTFKLSDRSKITIDKNRKFCLSNKFIRKTAGNGNEDVV